MLIVAAGAERMHLQTSDGRFPAEPHAIYAQWAEFRGWVDRAEFTGADSFDPSDLGSPAPAPGSCSIGLNYRAHALEAGFAIPEDPPVFTKYVSSITGPINEVTLPRQPTHGRMPPAQDLRQARRPFTYPPARTARLGTPARGSTDARDPCLA